MLVERCGIGSREGGSRLCLCACAKEPISETYRCLHVPPVHTGRQKGTNNPSNRGGGRADPAREPQGEWSSRRGRVPCPLSLNALSCSDPSSETERLELTCPAMTVPLTSKIGDSSRSDFRVWVGK